MSRDPMRTPDDVSRNTIQNPNQGLSDMKDRVVDMTSKMKDKAGQVAETVSEQLGHQRENVADTLGRAASALHQKANDVPGGPKVVRLTHSLADGMESTASYLRGHDFSEMGKDVLDVCRRNPKQSLIAALAIGFLIGRSRR
jgi:membrane-bound lytic murein transglycosylase B